MVFTPPSVPPLAGDRNLREEEGNRPTVLYLPHLSLPCGRIRFAYKENNGFSIADYNNPDEKKARNLQVISK